MARLVILHSTIDTMQVQILAGLAMRDKEETGLEPWVDAPETSQRDVGTIGASTVIDRQIKEVIGQAEAIVYIVGGTGAGPYQTNTEAELVKSTLLSREAEGRPVRFIPVLLQDGRASDLPEWAREYVVVNHDRSLRSAPALWESIKQRLKASTQSRADAPPPPELAWQDSVDLIVESLLEPPRLTVFIGPYSLETAERDPRGPAAVTAHLLKEIGIASDSLFPILPWPSEAAQWAMFVKTRDHVQELMRRLLAPLGLNPPDLATSIGELGRRWIARYGERAADEDWHGLLLITTRADLALESALSRNAQVGFTRILPTLNDAVETPNLRRMVQQWRADPNWDPQPTLRAPSPHVDIGPEETGKLSNFAMDQAQRIVLIKLCGSLDVPASLVLTAYDFFKNVQNFESLPKIVNEIIGASPHLLLGRGFASPLAQLIRFNILKTRQEDRPRMWVVSESDGPGDPLCDLEMALLDKNLGSFTDALKVTRLCRAPEDDFVRRLAAGL